MKTKGRKSPSWGSRPDEPVHHHRSLKSCHRDFIASKFQGFECHARASALPRAPVVELVVLYPRFCLPPIRQFSSRGHVGNARLYQVHDPFEKLAGQHGIFTRVSRSTMARLSTYNATCLIYVAFGAFFYGYDSGCTTSIFGYPAFIEYFGFTSTTLGALGSSYYGGNFIGNIVNFYLPDKIGRVRTIQLASVISILGSALQTGAPSIGVLMAGRVIGGFACGIVYSCCPLYASEISPPAYRGRVGGLYR